MISKKKNIQGTGKTEQDAEIDNLRISYSDLYTPEKLKKLDEKIKKKLDEARKKFEKSLIKKELLMLFDAFEEEINKEKEEENQVEEDEYPLVDNSPLIVSKKQKTKYKAVKRKEYEEREEDDEPKAKKYRQGPPEIKPKSVKEKSQGPRNQEIVNKMYKTLGSWPNVTQYFRGKNIYHKKTVLNEDTVINLLQDLRIDNQKEIDSIIKKFGL